MKKKVNKKLIIGLSIFLVAFFLIVTFGDEAVENIFSSNNLNSKFDAVYNNDGGGKSSLVCTDFKTSELYKSYIYPAIKIVQILAPILVVALGSLDILKAVTAQNEDQMKKAQKLFVKRLVIGLVILFLPVLLSAFFNLAKLSHCGI